MLVLNLHLHCHIVATNGLLFVGGDFSIENFTKSEFDRDRRQRRVADLKAMQAQQLYNYDEASSSTKRSYQPNDVKSVQPREKRRRLGNNSTKQPDLNIHRRVPRIVENSPWSINEVSR